MNIRTLASFAVAIFLGLLALIGVRELLNARQANSSVAAPGQATTPVVVAAIPIERGTGLKPIMLKTVPYPSNSVPTGAFKAVDQAIAPGDRKVLRSMTVNEPVLASKLSGPNAKTNLSGALASGMRAVSVRSSDVTGVGGFALPGDRVDIYLTRTVSSGEASSTITQAIAENVLVLGVDQTSDQQSEKPLVSKSVTVEVTPTQAAAVALGQSVGLITLSLRQLGDQTPLSQPVMTFKDLSALTSATPSGSNSAHPGQTRASRTRPNLPKPDMVKVIRGTETSNYSIGS
jgi:pilus assembly protein CpaB